MDYYITLVQRFAHHIPGNLKIDSPLGEESPRPREESRSWPIMRREKRLVFSSFFSFPLQIYPASHFPLGTGSDLRKCVAKFVRTHLKREWYLKFKKMKTSSVSLFIYGFLEETIILDLCSENNVKITVWCMES